MRRLSLCRPTEESYRYNIDHALLKFRGRAVADITRTEVRDLYEELKLKRGKTSAGGAMRVLRALINTAMRIDETILSNPCSAIRISAPPTRKVAMLDIPAWWAETEKLLPMRRDLHRAMLLTGARRTSILTVRRADVDLERKVLTFQHMKVGAPMAFPMSIRLTEMLRKRLDDDEPLGSEWLWLSGSNSLGRTVDPRTRGHDDLPSAHEYCNTQLAYYKAPGWILFLDQMPMTPTQKVNKTQILMPGEDATTRSGVMDLRAMKRPG